MVENETKKNTENKNSGAIAGYIAEAKPEGRKGIWIIDKENAKKIVDRCDDYVHNYIGGGNALLGADWEKKSVIDKIEKAERIALLTGDALMNNLRHGLSVICNNKLYMFDVGNIKVEELQILAI